CPSIVTVDDLQPGDQLPGEWVERAVLRIKRRIWEGPIHVELRGAASRAIQMAAAIGFTASALGPLPGESQQDVGRAGWSEDRPVGAKEPGDARRGDGSPGLRCPEVERREQGRLVVVERVQVRRGKSDGHCPSGGASTTAVRGVKGVRRFQYERVV